jgi:hypothetical protein
MLNVIFLVQLYLSDDSLLSQQGFHPQGSASRKRPESPPEGLSHLWQRITVDPAHSFFLLFSIHLNLGLD